MKSMLIAITVFLAAIVTFSGCGGGSGGQQIATVYGQVKFQLNLQAMGMSRGLPSVTKIEVIGKIGQSEKFSQTIPYTSQTTITCQVPVGSGYVFTINARHSNNQVEFTGKSGLTNVLENTTTDVSIVLEPPTTDVSVDGVIHEITGPPEIHIDRDHIPPYGSWGEPIIGTVKNVIPSDAKVLTWILVRGNWWVKPYANNPFVAINNDGTFKVYFTTGGVDDEATEIRVYLVSKDYPANAGFPADPPTSTVWAMDKITRTPQ